MIISNILLATYSNCGKFLKVLNTSLLRKLFKGPRLIVVPNSNKFKNWTIRSQASKALICYEEGSETRCIWV